MYKFKKLISKATILKEENVDTDQIVPARFLKAVTREGFGDKLFHDWRFDEKGNPKESIFNDKNTRETKILVVEKDFGIGSSREHAAWALYDFGFRVVIGTTFGDIFYTNSLKNGLLIVKLKRNEFDDLVSRLEITPDLEIEVDLEKQIVVLPDKIAYQFPIEPFSKKCLVDGADDIGYILSKEEHIENFEMQNT